MGSAPALELSTCTRVIKSLLAVLLTVPTLGFYDHFYLFCFSDHLFFISFFASLPALKFYPHASTLSPTHSFWTISVLFESLSLAPTTIRTKTHFSSCTLEDCTIWFQFSHQPPAVSLFPGSLCCSQTSLHIAETYHFLPPGVLHISGCPAQPTP